MKIKVTVLALEMLDVTKGPGKVKLEGKDEVSGYTHMLYVYVPLEKLSTLHLGQQVEVDLHIEDDESVGDSWETYKHIKEQVAPVPVVTPPDDEIPF